MIVIAALFAVFYSNSRGQRRAVEQIAELQEELAEVRRHASLPSHASREMCCAIRRIYPHALHGVDYQLGDEGEGPYIKEWFLEHPVPEPHHLDDAIAAHQREVNESQYRDLRRSAYPSIEDQLDALYKARHGNDAEVELIDNHIKRVKERYPKPERCRDDCGPVPLEADSASPTAAG
ncbi:MAG: XkdW family protein [Pseudomonadota bacterium]